MTIPRSGLPSLDDDRLRRLTEQATAMAAKAREAGERLNRVEVSVTSRNRAATVTVGSGGVLKAVRPGPGAGKVDATHLCAAIMEAYGAAARQAAAEASELMQSITGRDTRVMQMMRDAMPPAQDEAQA